MTAGKWLGIDSGEQKKGPTGLESNLPTPGGFLYLTRASEPMLTWLCWQNCIKLPCSEMAKVLEDLDSVMEKTTYPNQASSQWRAALRTMKVLLVHQLWHLGQLSRKSLPRELQTQERSFPKEVLMLMSNEQLLPFPDTLNHSEASPGKDGGACEATVVDPPASLSSEPLRPLVLGASQHAPCFSLSLVSNSAPPFGLEDPLGIP